jgi:hypothetical protein
MGGQPVGLSAPAVDANGRLSKLNGQPLNFHARTADVSAQTFKARRKPLPKSVISPDLGYRGVDQANPGIDIKHRGKFKSLTQEERKNLKRRQAIEPIIGHLKERAVAVAVGITRFSLRCTMGQI